MKRFRDAVKAAAYTAVWVFVAIFGAALLGFIQQVGEWASAGDGSPFPDVSVLGFAFIAAVCAALSFVVAAVVRAAQTLGVIPGRPPSYSPLPLLPDHRVFSSGPATSGVSTAYTLTEPAPPEPSGFEADVVQELVDRAYRAGKNKKRKPKIPALT